MILRVIWMILAYYKQKMGTLVTTINYSSDASSIGTIIYDNNLHNNCDQVNTPWGKTCQRSTYYIDYFIIIVIL